ncbi:MAG TPA: hypothetical protein VIJ94_05590 [Caulobacteraceae bacterium]
MPSGFDFGYPNLSPAIRTWESHYMLKGCSVRKAGELARRKVHRNGGRPCHL